MKMKEGGRVGRRINECGEDGWQGADPAAPEQDWSLGNQVPTAPIKAAHSVMSLSSCSNQHPFAISSPHSHRFQSPSTTLRRADLRQRYSCVHGPH